ncbi:multiheme c-type cytochrome [Carboxydothermus pertinax]|uniref:Nitrate/TMAO reductase membrane-bound tetraheme cytochrome C subunit n=1 Tax=Carboxydothermus pertinax TaxID=870242 RepID=A0A1L8CSE4_9THEO|nr:multiheme c-type cytochrome [Carboxydothermus pertinax]GAV21846.1 nitrate/TMAO reductase membrane-bound tetraheme cytochrome C subunit [Carboxydothermus pertinax]
MQPSTRRMVAIVGLGTIVGVIMLLLSYRYVIGPKGVKASLPTLSAVTVVQGKNKSCLDCHEKKTPGIVHQFFDSKHAGRGVQCLDCHKPVEGQEKLTKEHYQVAIVAKPTPNNCAQCHEKEVKEFTASNHAARSWYAVTGAKGFSQEELAKYHLLDATGQPLNKGKPNVIYTLIGKDAASQSCQVCHGIGKKNEDGSFGDCTKCHLRHNFDIAQARKPETCGQCHLGPDHPQIEIYNESAHGTFYQANKEKFNMEAPAGTLTVKDFPAPTCATCHMSAFGNVQGTHNVGERLKWYLAPELAKVRQNGEQNRETMKAICLNCHTQNFVEEQMTGAEKVIALSNENVEKGKALLDSLRQAGLIGQGPLKTPLEFLYFELWHHEGRRARFGAVMGGADFVNWHGIYEQKKALVEMEAEAKELEKKH